MVSVGVRWPPLGVSTSGGIGSQVNNLLTLSFWWPLIWKHPVSTTLVYPLTYPFGGL